MRKGRRVFIIIGEPATLFNLIYKLKKTNDEGISVNRITNLSGRAVTPKANKLAVIVQYTLCTEMGQKITVSCLGSITQTYHACLQSLYPFTFMDV